MTKNSKKIQIGITGGMGSGKSRVADLFAELGYQSIAADNVGHNCLSLPDNQQAIIDHFGDEVRCPTTGTIDRFQLKQRIFSDSHDKQWLEALLHPQIITAIQAMVAVNPGKPHVIEIPILVDRSLFPFLDKVVAVNAAFDKRVKRIVERDQLTLEMITIILKQQPSLQQLKDVADDIIDNNGSYNNLKQLVNNLNYKYSSLSS